MSAHATLRISRAEPLGPDTRLLAFERSDGAELGFAGGQYVIVNTGLTLPNGKAVKRAYSLLSSDADQRRAEIAVKRLPDGPGSGLLHELAAGAELPFSGPWGKLRPEPGFQGRALVVATDTGITAALGLVRSAVWSPDGEPPELVWLAPSPDDFVPEPFVRERVPRGFRVTALHELLPVGHPERGALACSLVAGLVGSQRYDAVFCAGDGAVIYPLRDLLASRGVPHERVHLESFFNNPQKKSA